MSNELTTIPSRTTVALVARRELLTRLRSRAFLAGLAATVFMVFAVFGISRLLDDGPTELTVATVGTQPSGIEDVVSAFNAEDEGTLALTDYDDRADAEADLEAGEIDAIVVDGDELVVTRLDDDVTQMVVPVWQQARLVSELTGAGTDPAVVAAAQAPLAIIETETDTDTDEGAAEGTAFGITIVLFIAVQIGGSFLMMGVLEEKGTRVIEIVLSSIRPRDLLAGKLLGIGVVGLIQVVVMAAAVLCAAAAFGSAVLSALDAGVLVASLASFVVGYLFWGSLYAAGASLATGMEDAQSTLTPVSIGVFISYLVAAYVTEADDSMVTRVASWLPIVSPFSMPGRMAAGDVPWWEVIAVLMLAVAATAGVLRLAERAYLRSVLVLDRRVGWREALGRSAG